MERHNRNGNIKNAIHCDTITMICAVRVQHKESWMD